MHDPLRHPVQPQAHAQAQAWGRAAPEPYGPMLLTPAARAGLMALRLFLGLITVMAAVTFLHGLHGG
jgi:hypothetical protein